jgi:hypothetical protein
MTLMVILTLVLAFFALTAQVQPKWPPPTL